MPIGAIQCSAHVEVDNAWLDTHHAGKKSVHLDVMEPTQNGNQYQFIPRGIIVGAHDSDTTTEKQTIAIVHGWLFDENENNADEHRIPIGQLVPIAFAGILPRGTTGRDIRIYGTKS